MNQPETGIDRLHFFHWQGFSHMATLTTKGVGKCNLAESSVREVD